MNQNLMPIEEVNSRRTREKHETDSRKAGIKSGQVRREKKLIKDVLKSFLSSELKDKKERKTLKEMGFENTDLNNQTRMIAGIYNRAITGDVKAFEIIRDTIGEKPVDEIRIEDSRIEIINDIANMEEKDK